MREGWEKIKLKDFAIINPSEKLPKGTLAKKVPMEVLQPYTKKITSFVLEQYKGGVKFKNGDTLVARITPSLENGKTAFVDFLEEDEIAFGSTEFIVLREKENISDAHFLYYLAISPEFREVAIRSMTGSSGRQRVQNDVIANYEFFLPPLSTQKKIARILSALDDKIELNRQMNRTLEATAQTIFKSWFVDFDPVHAKAACRTEADYEAAAKRLGISREVLELFPDEFEESEPGMIPKGWEVSTIGKEFSVVMGQSPAGSSYNEEKKGMIFFQGRRDFGDYYPTERVYTTEPKRIAQEDDILLSVRAPVGDINIALKKCCIGRGLAALKHKNGSVSYSFFVLKELRKHFENFNTEGTVFGSLNQKTLKSLPTFAGNCVIDEFTKIADSIFESIKSNTKEIQTLQQTRDTLLPKLLSGELDVSEVEI